MRPGQPADGAAGGGDAGADGLWRGWLHSA
eukprot:COSAG02_NODE_12398_length_1552_cov_49.653820_2_plen_29_part_01